MINGDHRYRKVRTMRHKKLAVLAATGALALVSACGGGNGGTAAPGGAADGPFKQEPGQTEILLPFPEGLPMFPTSVAKEKGYFTENGDDAKISVADGSGYVSQQLVSGNVNFALMGSSDAVIAASKREDVRVLFCHQVNNVYRIAAVEGSGVTDMQGLKGKTIGITEPGGGENQVVKGAVADAGLRTPGDVTLLPIGGAGPQALAAIKDGKVQAYASSYPDFASLGANGVRFDDITPEKYSTIPGTCMVTTQAFLDSPGGTDKAAGVTKAWIDSLYLALEHEQEAYDIVCRAVATACANPEAAKALYTEALNVVRPDNPGDKPGDVKTENWETVKEVLTTNGVLKEDIDLTNVVSGGTLDQIKERAYAGR